MFMLCTKTTSRILHCKKLGTSDDVKGFAIGSFLEHIVVERANDDLCWWPRQRHWSDKHKTDQFQAKFALKK